MILNPKGARRMEPILARCFVCDKLVPCFSYTAKELGLDFEGFRYYCVGCKERE